MSNDLISVIVLTYNQERFIKMCLEGILKQENVNFELVVFDDCSEDNTWQVIQSFENKEGRINSFRNKKNLGPSRNFEGALKQCKGKYIALCEGDDIWTSEEKLSRQIAGIHSAPNISLVYANYAKISDSGKELMSRVLKDVAEPFELKDMLSRHGPATNSVLIRRDSFPKIFPNSFYEVLNPDVFIIGYGLKAGDSLYLDQTLSAHREHHEGIWTSLDRFEQGLIRYSTLIKFYRAIKNRNLEKQAAILFERQVILAREKDQKAFRYFFDELPIKRRWSLGLKWAYANIKNSRN